MNDQTIYRIRHGSENPYFMIVRASAQDKTLPFDALGMLVYLLSKPDDWQVRVEDLVREGCGRDQAYRILGVLVSTGYATREQAFGNGHKFQPITYNIYEKPLPENPYTEVPYTEKPTLHNTESTETEEQKKNSPVRQKPRTGSTPIYGAAKHRVPDKPLVPGVTEEKTQMEWISFSDPNAPLIARDLFRLMEAVGSRKPYRLSQNQLAQLRLPVMTPSGVLPSPEAEAREFPNDWKRFIDGISDMPAWIKRVTEAGAKPSAGLLIDFIRGYHWQGGWLEYKSGRAETEVESLYDMGLE